VFLKILPAQKYRFSSPSFLFQRGQQHIFIIKEKKENKRGSLRPISGRSVSVLARARAQHLLFTTIAAEG